MKNVLYRGEFKNFLTVKFKDHSTIEFQKNFVDEPIPHLSTYNYTSKHPKFIQEQTYNDEQTYTQNLKNHLCSVSCTKITVIVEEYDGKVGLKLFWNVFSRGEGKPWFKVSKNVEYISVNKSTGDVYVGYIHNYQKKRKNSKAIRRNYFVNEPLAILTSKIKNYCNSFIPNSSEVANDVANIFINAITVPTTIYNREQNLFKFYLDKKNFRYPNNFYLYTNILWEKEFKNLLRKNGNRFVDALMVKYQIKGKKLKKALHQTEKLNIDAYLFAQKLFGEDWLNQNESSLVKLLDFKNNLPIVDYDIKNYMSKEELKRLYNILINSVCDYEIETYTFLDHLRTYVELKNLGELDVKWMSDGKDYKQFMDEHLDWTDKLQHYKKGTYYRTYPEYFFERIEKTIDGYYPVILTNSSEYNSESNTQSNCVKGYIGRPSSFIISLRRGTKESDERATIEYYVKKFGDTVDAKRIQTLGRFNSHLDDTWNDVLLKLDEIVLSCHQDQEFKTVEIKKECSNKVILKTDSYFDELGTLRWSDKIDQMCYIW